MNGKNKAVSSFLAGLAVVLLLLLRVSLKVIRYNARNQQYNTTNQLSEKKIKKELLEAASKINKTLPKMIDEETRADSVSSIYGQLNYYYTRKERELGSPVSKERGSKATRRIYSPLGMMRVVNIVYNFCRTNFPCRVIKITASPQTRKFA